MDTWIWSFYFVFLTIFTPIDGTLLKKYIILIFNSLLTISTVFGFSIQNIFSVSKNNVNNGGLFVQIVQVPDS